MRRVDGAASYDGIPLPLASDRGENHLQNAIQANRVYLAIENRSIYGIFITSPSLLDSFFPETTSREKELRTLLATEPRGYEETVIIEYLAVDPRFRGKGYGREMVRFVTDNHRDGLVLVTIPLTNEKAVRYFRNRGFLARGFIELEGQDPQKQVLLSWRLHERTASYKAHDNSRL